jgi:hypothetical protein
MKHDWVAIVEAGYRLEGTDADWLDALLACAGPLLDRGFPPIAWIRRASPSVKRRLAFGPGGGADGRRWIKLGHRGEDPRLYDLLYGSGRCVGTARGDWSPVAGPCSSISTATGAAIWSRCATTRYTPIPAG